MRMLLSVIKKACFGLLIAFVLLAGLAVFLLTSTPGLYVSTKVAALFLPGKLSVSGLSGRLIDQLAVEELTYTDQRGTVHMQQVDLHWRLRDLLHRQLNIDHLRIATVHYAGKEIKTLDLQAQASREVILIERLNFVYSDQAVSLMGEIQPSPTLPLNALLTLKNQGKIRLTGDLKRYELKGRLAAFQIKGNLDDGSRFQLLLSPDNAAIQPVHINGNVANGTFYARLLTQYNDNKLEGILRYADETLHASANLGLNQVQVDGKFPSQLTLSARLPNPALLHPVLGPLKTSINISALLQDLQTGKLTVTIGKGEYEKILFEGGQTVANLNAKGLDIKGQMNMDKDRIIQLSVNLPRFKLTAINPATQALRGRIRFDINSLAFLKDLNPAIGEAQGKLQALLNLAGTLKKPRMEGDLKLLQARLSLPKLGIVLNPVQLDLHSKDNQWTVKSSLVSNGHALAINGSGDFAPVVKGLLSIQGEMVPVVNTVEYVISASPKLTFEFTPSSLKMRGELLIPKAQIKPRAFTETVSLSDDVVFVTQANPAPNPYNIDTDIQVTMGDEVVLGVKGLQGFLGGGVRVQQIPKGPMTATGELSIREGKYRAYGQDLLIEQGQLLFTGGLIENPGIRVRATRQFKSTSNTLAESSQIFNFNSNSAQSLDFGGKITVGIEVLGRLSKPKVRLFSIPSSMSQADILSMLLLGKPASQASQSGGQLLLTAVSALNLDAGSGGVQLLGQLKQKLGIDFNLANNTQYNQKTNQSTDNTAVVIGKSLSKRLYASYNVGLSQNDSNVLTLNYLLNKFFSIQVNASTTASGIDLLYTHQKE